MRGPLYPEARWDPSEGEREYLRSKDTGNLGWVVRRGEREFVRLDRPQEEVLFPLRRDASGDPIGWVPEERPRTLGPGQAARIAFEGYRALCAVTGKPNRARIEWLSASESWRLDFMKSGPPNPTALEKKLWEAMMKVLLEES